MRLLVPLATLVAMSFAAPSWAESQEERSASITISTADCRRLVVKHTPAPDVAYKEGVDVRGRPVVPADLEGGVRIRTPERVAIEIIVPLRAFLGYYAPPRTEEAEVYLGTVILDGDRLFYEGQPLDDPVTAAIAAECRRILAEGR
jgi:hypothetical protein